MKKLFVYSILCVLTISVYAQPSAGGKKVLSLEDAILRQFSELRPKSLSGLKWVKETGQISYFNDQRDEIIVSLPNTRKPDTRIELFRVNESLNLAMKRFPAINWLNANTFYFQHKNAFYKYDLSARKGDMLLSFSERATATDYNEVANHLAYT
ncbi:MAG: hypothetical protein AAF990_21170, partial [Bacteroidota bacterium]